MEESFKIGEPPPLPKVEEKVILKLLKYKKKDFSKISPVIEEGYKIAYSLSKPRYAYKIFPLESLPHHPIFERASYVALALCTIGEELETEASKLTKAGELVRGLIVDILGSEIVEMVADYANSLICKEVMERGLFAGKRFSPGYGIFELGWQKNFFTLLPADSIGVKLLQSLMMFPRKSISFAVNIYKEKRREGSSLVCRFCELTNCGERGKNF